MNRFGLDSNGFIISEVSQDKILPQYRRVIAKSVAVLVALLPDVVHSVYVYGSVARGNAVQKKSDLDLLIVFKRALIEPERSALIGLQENLSRQYKELLREIGIANSTCTYDELIDPANEYGWGAYLKILCVCVYGDDLKKRFNEFKVSPEIAIGFNGDIGNALQSAIQQTIEAKTDEEASKTAARIARKLVRTCYMMVMTRAQVWTTILSEQAKLFLYYFPEKREFMRTLQDWIDNPLVNRGNIFVVLDGDCRWVVDNFDVEARKA